MRKLSTQPGSASLGACGMHRASVQRTARLSVAMLMGTTAMAWADQAEDVRDASTIFSAAIIDALEASIVGALDGVVRDPNDIVAFTFPEDNGTPPQVVDAGAVTSPGAGQPAIDLTPAGDLRLFNGTTVTSAFDLAPGILAGEAPFDTASVFLSGGSSIRTTGDGSAGIDGGPFEGPGDRVVAAAFSAQVLNSTIETTGENANGISVGDGSGGGGIANISVASDGTGPRASIETSGAGSDAIAFDASVGGQISLNMAIENSDVAATGSGSRAIDFTIGDRSNADLLVEDSAITSDGTAISALAGQNSTVRIVADAASVTATAPDSAGVAVRADELSVLNVFVNESVVNSGGPAISVEDEGTAIRGRVTTVTVFDSTLASGGGNVGAVVVGGEADGSASALTIENSNITLTGPGEAIVFEGPGIFSAHSTSLFGNQISATGEDAAGVLVGTSGDSNGSSMTFSAEENTITTTGDRAPGIVAQGAEDDDTTVVFIFLGNSITTQGAESTGLTILSDATGSGNLSSTRSVGSGTVISTSGANSAGLVIGTLGDGITDSDSISFIEGLTVVTEGDGATGVVLSSLGTGGTSNFADNVGIADITTSGDNAVGFVFNGPGTGHSDLGQTNIFVLDVSTSGATSHGAVFAFSEGNGASTSLNFAELNVTATGAGADAVQMTGTANDAGDLPSIDISVVAGDTVSSTDGVALFETGMNSMMTVAGTVVGDLSFGTGDDSLTFTGASFDISALGQVDGGVGKDTVRYDDATLTIPFTPNLTSIEVVAIEDSTLDVTDAGETALGLDASTSNGETMVSVLNSALSATGAGSTAVSIDEFIDGTEVSIQVTDSEIAADGTTISVGDDGAGVGQSAVTVNAVGSTLTSGSGGVLVVKDAGAGSTRNVTLDTTQINATGTETALQLAEMGDASTQLVDLMDVNVSATGRAIEIGGVGAGGNSSVSLENVVVATTGDEAKGVDIVGGNVAGTPNADLTFVVSAVDTSIATVGAESTGLSIATNDDFSGDVSLSYALSGSQIETTGPNSTGVSIDGLGDGVAMGDAQILFTDMSVETSGNGSSGIEVGTIGANGSMNELVLALTTTTVRTSGDAASGVIVTGAGAGNTDLDQTIALDLDVETTGANSHGLVLSLAEAGGASTLTASAELAITTSGAGSDAVQVTGMAGPGGSVPALDVAVRAGDVLSSEQGLTYSETGVATNMTVEGDLRGMLDFGSGDDSLLVSGASAEIGQLVFVEGGVGNDTAVFENADVAISSPLTFSGFEGPATLTASMLRLENADLLGLGLALDATSQLAITGNSLLGGDLGGSGSVSMANGTATDVFTVDGNLSGATVFSFDTVLDETEQSDLLVITGDIDAASRNTVVVANLGGLGFDTGQDDGDGILLVDSQGASVAENFQLNGDQVQAGAFIYELHFSSDGDYLLQSLGGISDAAHVYAKLPYLTFPAHGQLSDFPTGTASGVGVAQGNTAVSGEGWARVFGERQEFETQVSRAGMVEVSESELSYGGVQVGYRFALDQVAPDLGLQAAFHYMTATQDVVRLSAPAGPAGSSEGTSWGGALGLVYDTPTGYVEGAAVFSRSNFDMATTSGASAETDGTTLSLSVEAGRHFSIGDGTVLTPWARLGFDQIWVDGFTDSAGTVQANSDANQTIASLGLLAEHTVAKADGTLTLTGGLALHHRFASDFGVTLQGVPVTDSRGDVTEAEARLGLQYESGNATFFADISARQSISGSDEFAVGGSIGAIIRF